MPVQILTNESSSIQMSQEMFIAIAESITEGIKAVDSQIDVLVTENTPNRVYFERAYYPGIAIHIPYREHEVWYDVDSQSLLAEVYKSLRDLADENVEIRRLFEANPTVLFSGDLSANLFDWKI